MSDTTQEERPAPPQELQSQILAALASSSSGPDPPLLSPSKRDRSKGLTVLGDIEGNVQAVAAVDEDEEKNGRNKYDLYCPREGCGSVIMLKDVATLASVKEDSVIPIDPESHPRPACLPTLDISVPTQWWYLKGSPMSFENISFSKPVPTNASNSNSTMSVPRKFLACAECDLGPLGWAAGNEYWLAVDRVSYKI
ncbi:hypothetical protein FRC14_000259 [Serendipita sp. 396]|nr:hypothetical protein FRC14_000259 [Serendipita sp. 396]KAG8775051.1 hypothetical protein FRC15_000827 [Serendipita sp. 397]KAG8790193.1 hypothetical protein FRC16_000995 [Serendipita sp. 398]KAG8854759.1 hypothetical protein FRC20_000924 [Serendipita sp. 405]